MSHFSHSPLLKKTFSLYSQVCPSRDNIVYTTGNLSPSSQSVAIHCCVIADVLQVCTGRIVTAQFQVRSRTRSITRVSMLTPLIHPYRCTPVVLLTGSFGEECLSSNITRRSLLVTHVAIIFYCCHTICCINMRVDISNLATGPFLNREYRTRSFTGDRHRSPSTIINLSLTTLNEDSWAAICCWLVKLTFAAGCLFIRTTTGAKPQYSCTPLHMFVPKITHTRLIFQQTIYIIHNITITTPLDYKQIPYKLHIYFHDLSHNLPGFNLYNFRDTHLFICLPFNCIQLLQQTLQWT